MRKPWRSLTLAIVALLLATNVQTVVAGQVKEHSLTLSNNNATQTSRYTLQFDYDTTTQLGSISLEICDDTPSIDLGCGVPDGFDISHATIVSQSGETGFSVNTALTTANTIVFSRTAQSRTANQQTIELDNVVNPGADGTYYGKIRTFSSSDATGSYADYGGLAYNIFGVVSVSAEVPAFLIFCTAIVLPTINCADAQGTLLDVGDLKSSTPSSGTSQFEVATNASNGYNVRVEGATLTSGNDIIPALADNAGSIPGTGQFGLNLRANTQPKVGKDVNADGAAAPMPLYGTPNSFRFVSNEVLASANVVGQTSKFTVSYLVNVPAAQAPGVYTTTLTYICLANF